MPASGSRPLDPRRSRRPFGRRRPDAFVNVFTPHWLPIARSSRMLCTEKRYNSRLWLIEWLARSVTNGLSGGTPALSASPVTYSCGKPCRHRKARKPRSSTNRQSPASPMSVGSTASGPSRDLVQAGVEVKRRDRNVRSEVVVRASAADQTGRCAGRPVGGSADRQRRSCHLDSRRDAGTARSYGHFP